MKYSHMKARIMNPVSRRRHSRPRHAAVALQYPHFTSLVPEVECSACILISNQVNQVRFCVATSHNTAHYRQPICETENWHNALGFLESVSKTSTFCILMVFKHAHVIIQMFGRDFFGLKDFSSIHLAASNFF